MTDGAPLERLQAILGTDLGEAPDALTLGASREGRPLHGFRLGNGTRRVSLLGGCHADEPVGPLFLRRLVAYLGRRPPDDPLVSRWEWWIVPHANPDGEARNAPWQDPPPDPRSGDGFDWPAYLAWGHREPPGEDLEFGFPQDREDEGARPEARAIRQWWEGADSPIALHVSLHGMAVAGGPWLLLEPAWWERSAPLRRRFLDRVKAMGYRPHDVERQGEKGFVRLGPGFATRPDSQRMRDHFLALGDPETAARFRPSSMETARSLGHDALTLVTEMPLFLARNVGRVLGPPDPVQRGWRLRMDRWRAELDAGRDPVQIREEARRDGVRPMPIGDQMALQWAAVWEGLRQVEEVPCLQPASSSSNSRR